MRLLLDSHLILWYDNPGLLRPSIRGIIERSDASYISVASVWELTLKQTLGKLSLKRNIADFARTSGFQLLPISAEHAQLAGELPLHHRDPFDRMLVAQALLENLTLVTHDRSLRQDDVALLTV